MFYKQTPDKPADYVPKKSIEKRGRPKKTSVQIDEAEIEVELQNIEDATGESAMMDELLSNMEAEVNTQESTAAMRFVSLFLCLYIVCMLENCRMTIDDIEICVGVFYRCLHQEQEEVEAMCLLVPHQLQHHQLLLYKIKRRDIIYHNQVSCSAKIHRLGAQLGEDQKKFRNLVHQGNLEIKIEFTHMYSKYYEQLALVVVIGFGTMV